MESPIRNDEVKSVGLVQVLTPEQTEEQSRAREAEPQTDPVVIELAGHIRKCFTAADTAKRAGKKPIQTRLLQCSRQREGEYDPEKQALIDKQGGTNIYMMLTDIKCRAAESWLKDIMLPSGERPFAIESTPIPELPPDVVEGIYAGVQKFFQQNIASGRINPNDVGELGPKAVEKMRADLLKEIKKEGKKAAEQMTVEVNDQLTEGNWYQALSDLIEDVCSFPTAFIEGPIIRKKKVLEWHETPDGVGYTPIPIEKIVREYERFSPFDAFPSPGARSVQDGYFIRRLFYRRSDLMGMIGVEGFDETAIRNVLIQYGDGGLRSWIHDDNERAEIENKPNEDQDPEGKIECLKFWGNVQGSMLKEWGMNEQEIPDPDVDYSIVAYAIGEYVISARINPHPLGGRKLFSTSFKKKNDSIWGKCPPEMMRDIQDICNSCARAIVNNMAIGSGPQVWMIRDRLPIGQDAEDMFPWKIWPFESDKVKGRADVPMGFFQPTVITEKLLALYQYFFEQASEVTGIPAYIYGSDKIGGAGKTASGLSMLMGAASKGLRSVAKNIDEGAIAPSVKEHWLHVMVNEPSKARGDVKIVARASEYLIQQEQISLRRNEFMQTTTNPIDAAIMGNGGRAYLLRERAKDLKLDTDKIVPDDETIAQNDANAKIQEIMMVLSQKLNIPVENLMAIAMGQGGGMAPGKKPTNLDVAGNPLQGKAAQTVGNRG